MENFGSSCCSCPPPTACANCVSPQCSSALLFSIFSCNVVRVVNTSHFQFDIVELVDFRSVRAKSDSIFRSKFVDSARIAQRAIAGVTRKSLVKLN